MVYTIPNDEMKLKESGRRLPRKEKNVGMTFQETLYCSKISPINSGQFVTHIYIYFPRVFVLEEKVLVGNWSGEWSIWARKKGGEKNRAANEIEVMVDS